MEENAEKEARRLAMYNVRQKFWSGIGKVDSDVLAPMINPAFMGQPAWPDLRQAFIRIVTEDSVIFATDGLSDEFSESEDPDHGFEIELYVELPLDEFREIPIGSFATTWAFQLVNQAAMNAANSGAYRNMADDYNVFSTELYNVEVPDHYINQEQRVGVLIGMASKHVPEMLVDRDVRVLSLTIIQLRELEYLIANGGQGRRDLVAKLEASGNGNISSTSRKSVV